MTMEFQKLELIKMFRYANPTAGINDAKHAVERFQQARFLDINTNAWAKEDVILFIKFINLFASGKLIINPEGEILPTNPPDLRGENLIKFITERQP